MAGPPCGWYLAMVSPVTRAHFTKGRSGRKPCVLHVPEDPAVHRLEAVADVGQRPAMMTDMA